MKYSIALTGGIATGKSTVSKIYETHGWEIIDADKIAHTLLDEHSGDIANIFGKRFIKDNKVDRYKLGVFIFGDPAQRILLENFIHPKIRDRIYYMASVLDKKKKLYLIDLPLFFETSAYDISRSILVYAPKTTQLNRLLYRDALSREQALARIDAQMDIEEKREKAKYIIDNTGDFKDLEKECQRVEDLIKENEK